MNKKTEGTAFQSALPLGGREGEMNKEQRKYSEMVLAVK